MISFRYMKNYLLFGIKVNYMDMLKTDYLFFIVKLPYYCLCRSNSHWTADNLLNCEIVPLMPFVCFRFKMPVVIVL